MKVKEAFKITDKTLELLDTKIVSDYWRNSKKFLLDVMNRDCDELSQKQRNWIFSIKRALEPGDLGEVENKELSLKLTIQLKLAWYMDELQAAGYSKEEVQKYIDDQKYCKDEGDEILKFKIKEMIDDIINTIMKMGEVERTEEEAWAYFNNKSYFDGEREEPIAVGELGINKEEAREIEKSREIVFTLKGRSIRKETITQEKKSAFLSPESQEEYQRKREEIGRWGEKFVYTKLKEELKKRYKLYRFEENKDENTLKIYNNSILITELEWLNTDELVQEGYDLTLTENGITRYIEVKSNATDHGIFEISRKQWEFMKNVGDNYLIYRVKNANFSDARYEIIENPFKKFLEGKLQVDNIVFYS